MKFSGLCGCSHSCGMGAGLFLKPTISLVDFVEGKHWSHCVRKNAVIHGPRRSLEENWGRQIRQRHRKLPLEKLVKKSTLPRRQKSLPGVLWQSFDIYPPPLPLWIPSKQSVILCDVFVFPDSYVWEASLSHLAHRVQSMTGLNCTAGSSSHCLGVFPVSSILWRLPDYIEEKGLASWNARECITVTLTINSMLLIILLMGFLENTITGRYKEFYIWIEMNVYKKRRGGAYSLLFMEIRVSKTIWARSQGIWEKPRLTKPGTSCWQPIRAPLIVAERKERKHLSIYLRPRSATLQLLNSGAGEAFTVKLLYIIPKEMGLNTTTWEEWKGLSWACPRRKPGWCWNIQVPLVVKWLMTMEEKVAAISVCRILRAVLARGEVSWGELKTSSAPRQWPWVRDKDHGQCGEIFPSAREYRPGAVTVWPEKILGGTGSYRRLCALEDENIRRSFKSQTIYLHCIQTFTLRGHSISAQEWEDLWDCQKDYLWVWWSLTEESWSKENHPQSWNILNDKLKFQGRIQGLENFHRSG